jgi:NAD(P)-dependent dehydrogenase (short-subunit alcohol dehydrogenase family)
MKAATSISWSGVAAQQCRRITISKPMELSNTYPSLRDRVVLITGGATGIGANLVEAFCRQQARVAFIDVQDQAAGELVEQISASGGASVPGFFACDLLDIDALRRVIEQIAEAIGPVSVLINNAASDRRHDFRTVTEDFWNERINVNLRHPFFAIQAVYDQMKSLGGGSIINFGSMSWYECQGNMTGYTTSKAGLEGMTRGLARDLGRDNIRINTIVPGWVMTARQLRDCVDDDARREIERGQCLKQQLLPADISAMALFLASDDSRMCTAQRFIVDGGWI